MGGEEWSGSTAWRLAHATTAATIATARPSRASDTSSHVITARMLVSRPRGSQHDSRVGHPSSTPPRTVRAAGAPGLAALLIAHLCPISSLFAPCQPGAAAGSHAAIHAAGTLAAGVESPREEAR